MEESNNKLVVVLGMHRSGTSVLARGLKVLGVDLGDHLMVPVEGDNPKGFWEDLDIYALNTEILSTLNIDWHTLTPIRSTDLQILHTKGYFLRALQLLRKKTSDVQIFGFKDPRVTKLLPFWKEVFVHCSGKVKYVLTLRNPLSVSRSLAARNGFDFEKSYFLWLDHVLNSVEGVSGETCVVVDYDRLMQAPEREINRMAKKLDLRINWHEFEKFRTEFLDNELRHTAYQADDLNSDDAMPPLAQEVYLELIRAADDQMQLSNAKLKNKLVLWNQEFSRQRSALLLADKLFSRAQLAGQTLEERNKNLADVYQAMFENERVMDVLSAQVAGKEQIIDVLSAQMREQEQSIQILNAQLQEIYRSKAWHAALILRHISTFFIQMRELHYREGWQNFILKLRNRILPQIKLLHGASKKVSIIIPNYNGKRFLGECIDSLHHLDFPCEQYEIIIVDNASSDNSSEFISSIYPDVIFVQAETNLGFAGGCNLGIQNSQGEYIVLLNNDTVVDRNWLSELVKVVDSDRQVAIAGSKLLYKHNPNEIQNAMSFLTNRGDGGDVGSHQPDEGQYDTTREAIAVCGASMLIRRKLIEEIGALDEDFWAYYEDMDLCYRTRLYGKKIVFVSTSIVHHVHAATSGEWSPFFTFLVFRNKLLMHLKNSSLGFLSKVILLYFRQVLYESFVLRVNRKTHLKVLGSFAKKLPKFLLKRLYYRSIIKRQSDRDILLRLTKVKPKINASEVKKVCVYNAYLPTMGGGENLTAHIIAYVNSIFPSASVDILCHETEAFDKSRFTGKEFVRILEGEFDISLKNTSIRFIDLKAEPQSFRDRIQYRQKLSSITKEYDLFINNTFASFLPAYAKVNIFSCMFPLKYEYYGNFFMRRTRQILFSRFLKSYDIFLAISQYTQKWIDNYWKVNSHVLYPPVKTLKKSINPNKDNMILNVGRFFVSGHNKKQDVMLKAFIEMYDKGWAKDWKLVLVGRKHTDEASNSYIESLEDVAKNYPVELHYDTSARELQDLLHRAKIYWHATGYGEASDIHPERFEHYGLSTIEAAQFGVVPIVFNAGGQQEIVNHARNGFLWNTTDELMKYTKLLIDDKSRWDELSKNTFDSMETFGEEKQLRWFILFMSSFYNIGQ